LSEQACVATFIVAQHGTRQASLEFPSADDARPDHGCSPLTGAGTSASAVMMAAIAKTVATILGRIIV
jgi:hypothetical protein